MLHAATLFISTVRSGSLQRICSLPPPKPARLLELSTVLKPCFAPQPRCSTFTFRCAVTLLVSGKLCGSGLRCLIVCSISYALRCAPQSRQNSDEDPLLIWLTGTVLQTQRGPYLCFEPSCCTGRTLSDNRTMFVLPAGGPGGSSALAVFEGASRRDHTLVAEPRACIAVCRGQISTAQASAPVRDLWCNTCSQTPWRRAENGPYQLTGDDGEVGEREHAWDVNSNIVFVDSPIGVGYSYSEDPRDRVFNQSVVAADLLDFLEEFLDGAQGLGLRLVQLLAMHSCPVASSAL